MLQLTRRIRGGGGNKNRKRSAKKENTGRRVDQEKEKVVSELNEARITRMLRERSDDDIERLIKASVNWSKESLGVSDEIEEAARKVSTRTSRGRRRSQERTPTKAEDVRVSSNGDWTDMMSWTRHEAQARGKGVEAKESTREEETIEAEEKERTCQHPPRRQGKKVHMGDEERGGHEVAAERGRRRKRGGAVDEDEPREGRERRRRGAT